MLKEIEVTNMKVKDMVKELKKIREYYGNGYLQTKYSRHYIIYKDDLKEKI